MPVRPLQRETRLAAARTTRLLAAARCGSTEALGELLIGCCQYLLLIAERGIGPKLKAKVDASDLVQDTLAEAHRGFAQFSGNSLDDLRAWLGQILRHNLVDVVRHFGHTQKRSAAREKHIGDLGYHALRVRRDDDDLQSPSESAIRAEELELLRRALAALREDDRRVLQLRHGENLTFAAIGQRMNRSSDAARMLWWRAFERLTGRMVRSEGS